MVQFEVQLSVIIKIKKQNLRFNCSAWIYWNLSNKACLRLDKKQLSKKSRWPFDKTHIFRKRRLSMDKKQRFKKSTFKRSYEESLLWIGLEFELLSWISFLYSLPCALHFFLTSRITLMNRVRVLIAIMNFISLLSALCPVRSGSFTREEWPWWIGLGLGCDLCFNFFSLCPVHSGFLSRTLL